MTDEQLAKEWQTSPHWGGWRVGMVDLQGHICTLVESNGARWFHCGLNHTAITQMGSKWVCERIPDLTHSGTRSFLLEDVRRAWGCRVWVESHGNEYSWSAYILSDPDPWHPAHRKGPSGPTEQAALIAALRACSASSDSESR